MAACVTEPSDFDISSFVLSRKFIDSQRKYFIENYVKEGDKILDIGNQDKYPKSSKFNYVNLDITGEFSPDIKADITLENSDISSNSFDQIICSEVLEHVVDPFAAIRELRRILKVLGFLFITTPLNARIHGPIPDCWRFTEFGLRLLLRDFEILSFNKLDTPNRNLFPLHYSVIAQKTHVLQESDPRDLRFERVE